MHIGVFFVDLGRLLEGLLETHLRQPKSNSTEKSLSENTVKDVHASLGVASSPMP